MRADGDSGLRADWWAAWGADASSHQPFSQRDTGSYHQASHVVPNTFTEPVEAEEYPALLWHPQAAYNLACPLVFKKGERRSSENSKD